MLFERGLRVSHLALGAAIAASSLASGQVTNGSFEAGGGSFTGWNQAGLNQIADNSIGTGPTDGSYDALIATALDINGQQVNGTDNSHLESFLGLTGSGLNGIGNGSIVQGSAISQQITVTAGAKITFDWDFLTNQVYYDGIDGFYAPPDPANNDFSFVTLVKGSGPGPITKLADTFYGYAPASNAGGFVTGFNYITNVNNPFLSETGFHTTTLTATTAGTYTLGFGVVNASTGVADGINSGLLVDNIQVQSTPEPSSFLVFGSLGLGLLWKSRRRNPVAI